MKDDLIDRLYEIRESLKEQYNYFPYNCCYISAETIKEQLGLELIHGFYIKDGFGYEHCWNYDPKTDTFIDITATQFDSQNPAINIQKMSYSEESYVALNK
ncbi:MAG: hypothetical protein ACLFPQ_02225 [Candidatus Woesearchaeota archaeon]